MKLYSKKTMTYGCLLIYAVKNSKPVSADGTPISNHDIAGTKQPGNRLRTMKQGNKAATSVSIGSNHRRCTATFYP